MIKLNREIYSPCYEVVEEFLKRIDGSESARHLMFASLDSMNLGAWDSEPYGYHDHKEYLMNVVLPHKEAVYTAGLSIMQTFRALTLEQLLLHDMSKFSLEEEGYIYYVKSKKSKDQDQKVLSRERKRFQLSWHHHKNANKHHPEYWHVVERNGKVSKTIKIPEEYCLEMVADWIGASKTYGTPLDEWLSSNLSKFKIHPESLAFISVVLASQGYIVSPNLISECNKLYNQEVNRETELLNWINSENWEPLGDKLWNNGTEMILSEELIKRYNQR